MNSCGCHLSKFFTVLESCARRKTKIFYDKSYHILLIYGTFTRCLTQVRMIFATALLLAWTQQIFEGGWSHSIDTAFSTQRLLRRDNLFFVAISENSQSEPAALITKSLEFVFVLAELCFRWALYQHLLSIATVSNILCLKPFIK